MFGPLIDKGRDGTFPRFFFVPVNQKMRQIDTWDYMGFPSHRIPGRFRCPIERDSCPRMTGFVVQRYFSNRTVPHIFVPVPTVPRL